LHGKGLRCKAPVEEIIALRYEFGHFRQARFLLVGHEGFDECFLGCRVGIKT
jgi:hypothetical protein